MELTGLLKKIAEKMDYPYEPEADGIFKMVVPIPAGEGEFRSQIIVIKLVHGLGYTADKDVITVASVVGKLTSRVDLKMLLRENENLIYGKVSLDEADHIVVYGFTIFQSADLEELAYMIKEIAFGADRLEEIYLKGKDKN